MGWNRSSSTEVFFRPLYFECVLNGIVKGDEVVGASMLGRDVTEQREKELRFHRVVRNPAGGRLFQHSEDTLLDANPALVSMLGYVESETSCQWNRPH